MIRSVSIIIPAYNEEKRLPETLRRISTYLDSTLWIFYELIVVDDGSTDGTLRVARELAEARANVRVVSNPGNRGKGYSVRHGMAHAYAEWCLFTDADLSAPIEEIDRLWDAIDRDGSLVAIGSRALDRSLIGVHQPGMREAAGRVFNRVMRAVIGLPIADTQCGFKLFHRTAAEKIFPRQTQERFGFDVEILFIAKKLGFGISEVPVRWNHAEGSKVSMFNGIQAFTELAAVRWNDIRGKYD